MSKMAISGIPEITPELKARGHEFVEWLKWNTKPDTPAPAERLFTEFGLSALSVRLLVNWLRTLGDPMLSRIGSDNRGYYWLHSWSDAQHTLAQLRSRSHAIGVAADGICRAFDRDENQPELEL